MNHDEDRQQRDPLLWHQVRARLARIKLAIAMKQVNELVTSNMIEQELLNQRKTDGKEVRR